MFAVFYPSGRIEKDGVEQTDLTEWVAFLKSGGTPQTTQEDNTARITVTAWQLMQELIAQGLYSSVDSQVQASGNQSMIVGWTRASYFNSDNSLTLQIGAALGKSPAQMYALFQSAASR